MKPRKYHIVGLSLFLAGFLLFNISFFLEKYNLEPDTVSTLVSEPEKSEGLTTVLDDDLGVVFPSSFDFVKMLEANFEEFNRLQDEKYAVSDEEINQIVEATYPSYKTDALAGVFHSQSNVDAFKLKSLTDYSSWMEGREYASREALENDIRNVCNHIRLYEISGKKGFDRYQIKYLKFALTKASSFGPVSKDPGLFLLVCLLGTLGGALIFFLPLRNQLPGIKNNDIFFNPMTSGKWLGIITGSYLIGYYIILYFYPEYMTSWVLMVDPISFALKGSEAGQFFLYGFMYTIVILVMGVRMLWKYQHNQYQIFRTISVMFFQLAFAFLLPEILLGLNQPYFDFKNIWPLDYDFFFDNELSTLMSSGALGVFMLFWGVALIIVAVPVLTYFFGKRWYCSWVCGCGGLAETLGDPYRQLSDKSLRAWKIERYLIHGVLVFAVLMTAGVLYTYWTGQSTILGMNTYKVREVYGIYIGAGFAGVVGTGFYPFMGNRVWCRFGCPLAAYLGMVQRFKSRFRITTNGGQCISCGNCSTYCEMGIDVRWYAQRGQNIIRSSCVGCGICSAVCPRGVLNLETDTESGRFGKPIMIGRKSVSIAD